MAKLLTLKPRISTLGESKVKTFTDTERIRGTTLQNIRKAHFERHPLCVRCLEMGVTRIAVELDHIVPLHLGGRESNDPFVNRQGLCAEHHLEKSQQEQ